MLLSLFFDFTQALKHKHVEHRFPVAAIEPLDETILHRLSGFDELERHAMLLGPVSQRHGNKLWSIIQPQLEGIAAESGDPVKRAHHPRGRQIEVNFNRQQLAIEIVHDVEGPEAPPTPQRVAGKIRGPTLIHRCTHNQRRRASCRQTLFAFSSFVKLEAAIHAVDTFVIPRLAQPSQSLEQLPKPLFRSPLSQLQKQLHYFLIPLIPVRLRLVAIDRASEADYLTGLSFA